MNVYRRALCVLALGLAGLSSAYAGIQINGTRVIYPADQREVSVSMVNNGTEPRLIQAWVDSGDASERPQNSKAPFLVTPPMARIDPTKGQTLRIMITGANLPQDRESVFWLNVLEIPPKPKALNSDNGRDQNFLQMAVRSRLKMFYRPKGLPSSPDGAVDMLSWHLVSHGNSYAVECTNNTPYNVSFGDVVFKNTTPVQAVSKGGMCPAMGKGEFAMSGNPDASGGKLVLTVINDYGGFNNHEANFAR